jgi:hypothetical protein
MRIEQNFTLRNLGWTRRLERTGESTRGGAMNSHFWDIYRDVRSVIQKPDEAVYILYTSIGTITVRRFVYRGEAGYVFLQGIDENGRERIVGFSEQQLSTFAFEIRTKSAETNGQIRFNQNLAENLS